MPDARAVCESAILVLREIAESWVSGDNDFIFTDSRRLSVQEFARENADALEQMLKEVR